MRRPIRRNGLRAVRQAFDEVRFASNRILNLRESLPAGAAAATRAEAWLRQRQVDRAGEVLIITGRGRGSEGGFAVVRDAVIRLLRVLKRRGVVGGHEEHTPGSIVVKLAPLQALWESPRRNRGRGAPPPPKTPPSLDALDNETRALLRELAKRSLEDLGIRNTAEFVDGEMLRQFSAIATAVGDAEGREARLRRAIRAAVDQHDG